MSHKQIALDLTETCLLHTEKLDIYVTLIVPRCFRPCKSKFLIRHPAKDLVVLFLSLTQLMMGNRVETGLESAGDYRLSKCQKINNIFCWQAPAFV